jgi:glucose-6-phosphate 1-epimerase
MSCAEPVDFHGLPAIAWASRDGARAVATLQGAHLVSWTTPGRGDALFLSEASAFAAGRAIRGGIPVIFPQFADRGPMAQHGFARTQAWRFVSAQEAGTRASATFALESSPATLALWPHAFRLELVATIGGPVLDVRLNVMNPGRQAFAFTAALHTYLRMTDATAARVQGLRGLRYLTRGEAAAALEARELVTMDEAIDRIYFAPPRALRIEDGARFVRLEQGGFTDTVVWNPGREKAGAMADMAAGSFLQMLCVEAAAIEPPVVLEAGHEWTGSQAIEVSA